MKKLKDKAIINFYLLEKTKEEFDKLIQNGKQSDTLRGMIMLYLQRPHFRLEVDKFVEITKTI